MIAYSQLCKLPCAVFVSDGPTLWASLGELSAEVYYVHHLSSECDYETTMMLKKIRKAKMTGDQARVEQAKAMPKTSCHQSGSNFLKYGRL